MGTMGAMGLAPPPLPRFSQPMRTFIPTKAGEHSRVGTPTSCDPEDGALGDLDGNKRKMGTVDGVFLPCLQTILGVILFLRLPFITAQAGMLYTTAIILICVTSTLLTALSLSAIATNGTIRAGGPYYVISRTLGLEIGGALGLLFYLGNTVAASMYVLGAVEALASGSRLGFGHLFEGDVQVASLTLTFLLAVVVSVGVRLVKVTSNLFLGLVFLSVFCMCLGCVMFANGTFMGQLGIWDRAVLDNIWPNYEPDFVTGITPDFFSLLALFYPSVTGILAGSNRSGVLADPGRSIPRGTLSAIGATTAVYLGVVWLFGATIANRTLKEDKFIVATVAFPKDSVVKVGVVMSSIGAALQCFVGAPRLLQAIVEDDSVPMLRYLGLRSSNVSTHSGTEEDTVESASVSKKYVWITWFIASVPTLAGNLDHITPVVTMFYLLMYSGINLSCFVVGVLKSPGFRPTFKYFHWSLSLLGFVWCLGLALVINWPIALAAMGLFTLLYGCNKRHRMTTHRNWGDVGNSIRYTIVTALLRKLTGTTTEQFHAKNWRPQILTVVDTNPEKNNAPMNLHVLSLAGHLKKGRGINMVVSVVRGTPQANGEDNVDGNSGSLGFDSPGTCRLVTTVKSRLLRHMAREEMDGFAEVAATLCPHGSVAQCVHSAAVHSGLGPLSPNAVMLSYPDRWSRNRRPGGCNREEPGSPKNYDLEADYVRTVSGVLNLHKAVMLFKGSDAYPSGKEVVRNATIDVWWVVHDGGLLLLLPFIISKNRVWGRGGARLRLFAVATSPTERPDRLREAVVQHLSKARISASVQVVDMSDSTIAEDMRAISGVGFGEISDGNNDQWAAESAAGRVNEMTVGEVFSRETYDVPYHAISPDLNERDEDNFDMEYGSGRGQGTAAAVSKTLRPSVNVNCDSNDDGMAVSPDDVYGDDTDTDVDSGFGVSAGRLPGRRGRAETALAFNSLLRLHSSRANLVVTNLPLIRGGGWPPSDFFKYVDKLTDGLDNVLLVRGSGTEVITTYA